MLVLHYSGYGFAKRGAPLWLVRELQRHARLPLITMFHELYAAGPPTSSAFWLQPLMRWTARRLVGLSRFVVTNREASARWLGSGEAIPVFSSLGPMGIEEAERRLWLALFPYQANTQRQYWQRLSDVLKQVTPERIVALGATTPATRAALRGHTLEETGVLPAADVSRYLARCAIGYLAYPPAFLGKSGIFAAFAAHGLSVVLADRPASLPDGLLLGRDVLLPEHLSSLADPISSGHSLRHWYSSHDLVRTADRFARKIVQAAAF